MKGNKITFITYTAVFLALLLVVQYFSKPMGQFVTGSLVNFVLIAATAFGGMLSGVITALVSPFLAFFMGIGTPFVQLVPLIALGNVVLVVVYGFLFAREKNLNGIAKTTSWLITCVVGAIAKFFALYLGIVKIALPMMTNLKDQQLLALSATFSWPQLFTALIGGALAFIVIPLVRKGIKR